MGMKSIFKMYTVEERIDSWEEDPENVIGCFTSKKKAVEYAQKRCKKLNSRQHRITQFNSANWSLGESYEDFFKVTYKVSPPFPLHIQEMVDEGERQDPIMLISDWDYFI